MCKLQSRRSSEKYRTHSQLRRDLVEGKICGLELRFVPLDRLIFTKFEALTRTLCIFHNQIGCSFKIMSTKVCSPSLSTRKRSRVRDPSPDMFAVDEDDEDDSFSMPVESEHENCVTPSRRKFLSKSFSNNSSPMVSPSSGKQQILKQTNVLPTATNLEYNNQILPLSNSKLSANYSISSLMSTGDANHFGLNSRMKEALRSNKISTCRLEFSTNSSLSCETPAIYTLNNSTITLQTSIHSGPNFGLSDGVWKIIQESKGIKQFYDWQIQCLNKAIKSNKNLLYSLPTSGKQ